MNCLFKDNKDIIVVSSPAAAGAQLNFSIKTDMQTSSTSTPIHSTLVFKFENVSVPESLVNITVLQENSTSEPRSDETTASPRNNDSSVWDNLTLKHPYDHGSIEEPSDTDSNILVTLGPDVDRDKTGSTEVLDSTKDETDNKTGKDERVSRSSMRRV